MTKTKRKRKMDIFQDFMKVVGNMTYKDLKVQCVIRGLEFEKVINGDFPTLQNWLYYHLNDPQDSDLLNQYDDWLDKKLIGEGKADLVHPSLRLGYIGKRDENGKVVKKKRPKGVKKKKKKREKTKDGIYKGTKKALVFECQEKGYSIKKTIRKVSRKFDSFSEKSVKIWYKRASKR